MSPLAERDAGRRRTDPGPANPGDSQEVAMSELSRRYAIIEAPSILGLKPTGVDRFPARLLDCGLVERIRARHAGRVPTSEYRFERDPQTLTLNCAGQRRLQDRNP
jgi:hypothetical protein